MKPGRVRVSVPRPEGIHEPMLGRTKVSLPVCNSSSAPPCRELEPFSEWRKHISSAHAPTCGNSALTHAPHLPYCLNFHGEASKLPVSPETIRGLANGNG